jgi:hypothetical protein
MKTFKAINLHKLLEDLINKTFWKAFEKLKLKKVLIPIWWKFLECWIGNVLIFGLMNI